MRTLMTVAIAGFLLSGCNEDKAAKTAADSQLKQKPKLAKQLKARKSASRDLPLLQRIKKRTKLMKQ